MNKAISSHKKLIILGLPLFLVGIMVFLSRSNIFASNTSLFSLGITVDLLIIIPLIFYLLIRKTTLPKTAIIPLIIFLSVIGSWILPVENQTYLKLFKTWMFPFIELAALSLVIFNLQKAIKQFKVNKKESFDFYTTLKNTCVEVLPKGTVHLVATEIGVFYYGFIHWKRRPLKNHEFSYHKGSGTIALLIAVIFIVAIETVTFHHLLAKWNNTAAWLLTALSIYSGIQLFGFLKSMLNRPIYLENKKLYLRYGMMNETTIDLKNINHLEFISKDIETNKETRKLSILGDLESPNVLIKLKKENTLIGLYGINRKYKNIALYIDQKEAFKSRVTAAMNSL